MRDQQSPGPVLPAWKRWAFILFAPVTLAIFGLAQAYLILVGAAYYLVFDAGIDRLSGRHTTLPRAWVHLLSPLILAAAPISAVVQIVVWLLLALGRALVGIGSWQIGPTAKPLAACAGVVWIVFGLWLMTVCISAEAGWRLIGQPVPGVERFRQGRVDRLTLGELPAAAAANRLRLLQRANSDSAEAFLLANENHRFIDLPSELQLRVAGVPWYYTPGELVTREQVSRSATFGGTLLVVVLLLVRWPGLHWLMPWLPLRLVVFLLRVVGSLAAVLASLLGESSQPDTVCLQIARAVILLAAAMAIYAVGWAVARHWRTIRQFSPFLAVRLLQRKHIAFFSIGAVTLCVMMVLIVVSVMGGFLDKIRERSHGLMADIILDNYSLTGFPHYQGFMGRLSEMPEVAEVTPTVWTYGLLRFPTTYKTSPVQVLGIVLPETYRVNDFYASLFYEHHYPRTTRFEPQGQPSFGFDEALKPNLPPDLEAALARAPPQIDRWTRQPKHLRYPGESFPGPGVYGSVLELPAYELAPLTKRVQEEFEDLLEALARGESGRVEADALATALALLRGRTMELSEDPDAAPLVETIETALAGLDEILASWGDDANSEAIERLVDVWERFAAGRVEVLTAMTRPRYVGPAYPGIIIGRDLISERQASGQYYRSWSYPRGCLVTLTILPITEKGSVMERETQLLMRYVDDSRTGVYEIDSQCVYVEFALLQRNLNMHEHLREDGTTAAARTSEILVKLHDSGPANLRQMRQRIEDAWDLYRLDLPVRDTEAQLMSTVRVETWEVRQRKFIAAVEKEKILVLILFGVISLVAVFLILCIFYMIVVEKTRDIGILKSLGAGAWGVAAVFVIYGAAIGLVGAAAGLGLGTVFVHHINEIQDWLASIHPELRVWRADVYTFDTIPNVVKLAEAAMIFAVAILASVLGAVIPAVVAARRQPVEALRYE